MKAIRERLEKEHQHSGGKNIYQRLAVHSRNTKADKTYLDGVNAAERSKALVDEFLQLEDSAKIFEQIRLKCGRDHGSNLLG